ncbi:hypothetical protein BBK36DRAFT_157448 [Trichoderma citrinoviride]|uniref:Uncharacterized protein n=1 Tax=Trichoderma citrinoviride TaxID=58853 RepID=A0A2T4BFZ2_9HYPO|nr:hypothetical protein BBK36DRAFT_157448 [Trichoderma citrinoviride]PTB68235.1 hypothetical protein BBK36DRAFT_157448 [Trichoderma citrinoviride]
MLARDFKRLLLVVVPVAVIICTIVRFYHSSPLDIQASHQEIFSVSTLDRKYFAIDFAGELNGMNPNIIPHPTLASTWIVVAQLVRSAEEQSVYFTELVCNAVFQDGVLRCLAPPTALPVAPTQGNNCNGDLAFFGLNVGPHDARVLYGPESPYIVYGSNSQFTCFGQFIQDFRQLVDWGAAPATGPMDFLTGTELQRPLPWGAVEKNWFPFWDPDGQMYVHYDIAPQRVFARAQADGSVSVNLAVLTEAEDEKCLAKYMPKADSPLESVHQASNSLKITLCKRPDAGCVPNKDNTFIFTIWQHKTFYNFHGVYEPYVMLFQQEAPFAIHAVSRRPLWIHGRQQHLDLLTSDMFYVTSIAWKSADLRYHGYLDDELFIGFGIEDRASGAIDVTAEELMSGLGLCSEA